MKKHLYLLIFCLLCFAGRPASENRPQIIGGSNTTIDQQPWQVLLTTDANYVDRSGGVILSANWIVTAAHSVESYVSNPGSLKVYAGVTNIKPGNNPPLPGGQTIVAAQIILHKDYDNNTYANDIALVRLATPLSFNGDVQPIRFDGGTGITNPGTTATFSGWGTIDDTTSPRQYQDQLKRADLSIVDINSLNTMEYQYPLSNSLQIAAGGNGVGPCYGDSGGPLWVNSGGQNYLVGIDSFKAGVANNRLPCGSRPAIFTRVSSYCGWILEKMIDAVVINGTDFMCNGQSYNYSFFGQPSNTNFNGWSTSTGIVFNSESGNAYTNGNYSGPQGAITVTFSNACATVSKTKTVYVDNFISGTYVRGGQTYDLSSSNQLDPGQTVVTVQLPTAPSFTWTFVSGNPNPANWYAVYGTVPNARLFLTLNSGQSATFDVSATSSCGGTSRRVSFYVMSGYRAYPNPASSQVGIEFDNTSTKEALPDQVELFSEKSTKAVRSATLSEQFDQKAFQDNKRIEFDVRDLPRGIYYLHVTNSRRKGQEVDKIRLLLQ